MLATFPAGTEAVDFSFASVDLAQARELGYRAVIGYLPWDPDRVESGCLTHAIVQRALSLGMGWAGVWEVNPERPLGGRALGYSDGRAACASAKGLGAAPGAVVYSACDFDADPIQVAPYFMGHHQACQEAGFTSGCYGGVRVIDYVVGQGMCRAGWQATAWSGGRVSPFASMLQREERLPGTDHNDVLKPLDFTADPDLSASWATQAITEEDPLFTDKQAAQLEAICAAVAGPLTPQGLPAWDFAEYQDEHGIWKSVNAGTPAPVGGQLLDGLGHQRTGFAWLVETVTTVRRLLPAVNAMRDEMDQMKARLATQAVSGGGGTVDVDALAEAILQKVKSRLP